MDSLSGGVAPYSFDGWVCPNSILARGSKPWSCTQDITKIQDTKQPEWVSSNFSVWDPLFCRRWRGIHNLLSFRLFEGSWACWAKLISRLQETLLYQTLSVMTLWSFKFIRQLGLLGKAIFKAAKDSGCANEPIWWYDTAIQRIGLMYHQEF